MTWNIKAENIHKKFCRDLKQSVMYGLRDAAKRVVGIQDCSNSLRKDEFWALKNISFNVDEGESLGIMGLNGSGKSTLLRILNGTYSPDFGVAKIRGRVGALIAAGAGFSPMLSGRENVYVNGALIGVPREEIKRKFDEIVSFANLEDSIDMSVKHYSSGMFVRLGFAIAAVSRPQVLLVDEALAVGDLNFQKKCYDYILGLKKDQGTSVILVSHAPSAIWAVCDRAVILKKGVLLHDGNTEEIIRLYDEENSRLFLEDSKKSSESKSNDVKGIQRGLGFAHFNEIKLLNYNSQKPQNEFDFKEPIVVEFNLTVNKKIVDPIFRFTIDAAHYKFINVIDSYEQGFKKDFIDPGDYTLRVKIPNQNFRPGTYNINANICMKEFGNHLFLWNGACEFMVKHPHSQFLYADHNSIFHLDANFEIENQTFLSTTSAQSQNKELR